MMVLALTFISILLATFLLVIAMTRQSPEEKIVGQRMASIHISKRKDGISLEAIERELISRALEKFDGNQTQAARYLDISRRTLIYRMEKHGLAPVDSEPAENPS